MKPERPGWVGFCLSAFGLRLHAPDRAFEIRRSGRLQEGSRRAASLSGLAPVRGPGSRLLPGSPLASLVHERRRERPDCRQSGTSPMSAVPNTNIEPGSGTAKSIAPIAPLTSVVWLLSSRLSGNCRLVDVLVL